MSRPRPAPDPNKHPVCARCREAYPRAAIWPDGGICQYCYMKAKRTRGTCASCGHVGILPGLNWDNEALCRSCTGIRLNVDCVECGAEEELYRGGRCWRCELQREAKALLSPANAPKGKVKSLIDAIAGMSRPNSGLTWIRQAHVRDVLVALSASPDRLTHATLDSFEPSRTIEYIRSLLMEHGVLQTRDTLLAEFERWGALRPEMLTDPAMRPVLIQFIRWHQKRRIFQAASDNNDVVPRGVFLNAKQTTTVAINFLNWVTEKKLALLEVDQHAVDEWFGNGPSTRELSQMFIYWAQDKRHMGRVELPRRKKNHLDTLGVQGRLTLIRQVLTDESTTMTARVAGGMILLFAQPLNRTVSLRLDAIRSADNGDLEIRFAEDWVPIPTAFAVILDDWLSHRPNMQTAAHHTSPWLFPGVSPGQHLLAATVSTLLTTQGIPPRSARTAAWRELVRSVPPPLLASAFGVTPQTIDVYGQQAGSRFARYAGLGLAR